MEISIKQVVVQDAKGIHQFFWESIKENDENSAVEYTHIEEVEKIIKALSLILSDPSACIFVAQCENEIIGIVYITIKEEVAKVIPPIRSRKFGYIELLAVKKEYRKQGVGRNLMKRAEQWAKEKKISTIELEVYDHNKAVSDFYEQLQYKTQRRIFVKKVAGN